MRGALIALDLDGTAILDGHPHAALHLAATATARADASHLAGAVRRGVRFIRQRGPGSCADGRDGRGGRGQFDERASRNVQLCHFLLLLPF